MDQFLAQGFVQAHTLGYEFLPGEICISGHVACLGEIVLTVKKTLTILDSSVPENPLVQTDFYAYNASIAGYSNFLRYDNVHTHPGHPDAHHRHEMNWRSKDDPGAITPCGSGGWPYLSTFIEECEEWYWLHFTDLPRPDGVVDLKDYLARAETL